MLVVGGIFGLSGLGGLGFALGALAGVALAVLTELFRWDCSEEGVFWFPPRRSLPPLHYQEKFGTTVGAAADERISALGPHHVQPPRDEPRKSWPEELPV
jgi:hypothetical protein